MSISYKNFAFSAVATAPSPAASGTSLVVTTGEGTKFPTAPFYATIWPVGVRPTTANAEIVLVTAVSTDTFTIDRAEDGSSARTVVVGDWISNTVNAEALRQLWYNIVAQTSSVTIASSTSELTLIGTVYPTLGSPLTLPANFFTVGRSIRVEAEGYYGSTTSAAGNLTLKIKLGGAAILSTGAVALTTSMTNRRWRVYGIITCRTTGAPGTVFGQGEATINTSATAQPRWGMVNTATTNVTTTGTLVIDVTAQFSVSNAANTITCSNLYISRLY